jgi:deoxycytidylate deaminase
MKKRYCITSSAYDRKGNLIASRTNSYFKSHPLQKHFASLAGEPYKETLHSEIATLIACRYKKIDKLVVMRYDSFGNLRNAMPCKTCQAAIKAFGVEMVMYSTEEGMKLL